MGQYDVARDSSFLQDASIDYDKRKKIMWATGLSAYAATSTSLYFAWYRQFDQSAFHSFDDWGEWNQMDKSGHAYSAYIESHIFYGISRWAGYNEEKALKIGAASSILGQLSIEIMDGFSSQWGFSWSDMGSNLLGTSLFYFQQKHLGHQPIRLKMSYWPVSYDRTALTTVDGQVGGSLHNRSVSLFGRSGIERFLKDYNGQTIWLSAGLYHLFPERKIPRWLAISVGYSGQNLFGGRYNAWQEEGLNFVAGKSRSRQIILALDYDLSQIKTSNHHIQKILNFMNIFKWPAPGVSYSTSEGLSFHVVFRN